MAFYEILNNTETVMQNWNTWKDFKPVYFFCEKTEAFKSWFAMDTDMSSMHFAIQAFHSANNSSVFGDNFGNCTEKETSISCRQ